MLMTSAHAMRRRVLHTHVMKTVHSRLLVLAVACGSMTLAAAPAASVEEWAFGSLDGVKVSNGGRADLVTYRGRRAVHLIASPDHEAPTESISAILGDTDFANGTIEADVAGAPRAGAPGDSRGFIGLAIRVQPGGQRYENFYVRPTNGRADDQLRRNHAVQYTSEPDFPWPRLRGETPGKYESYADLEPGAWTALKIVVSARRGELYVNGASQPCLIVTDLKLGDTHGGIALWAHSSTDAYFSRVIIRRNGAKAP
jgi:hypothetical protein